MYRARFTQRKSPEGQTLREVESRRKSQWLSNVLAWLGALAGAFAVFALVASTLHAARLSASPRPNIGPGFSESTTAGIGGMIFGGVLSLVSAVLVGLALLHAKKPLRTLAFFLPAVLCISLLLFIESWAP